MPLNDIADRSGMNVQKNGTIIGIVQSDDPVKVRVQIKLDEESHEQRVRPFPRSEEEKMAEQMTEQKMQSSKKSVNSCASSTRNAIRQQSQ